MIPIDARTLYAIAPRFSGANHARQTAIVSAIAPHLSRVLAEYGITTRLRVAHWLAQMGHESAGFSRLVEMASGAAYEGNRVLGNTQPGDGVRFKGRGLIQLTGRWNYGHYGRLVGVDLIANPERAAEPVLSLHIACAYWNDRGCSPLADRDDVRAITKAINGGYNGLEDRRRYLERAKSVLPLDTAWDGLDDWQVPELAPAQPEPPGFWARLWAWVRGLLG